MRGRALSTRAGESVRPSFAALSGVREASALVAEALAFCGKSGGRALDLGAGPLNDTRLMLDHGFAVVAVDRDPHMVHIAAGIGDPRLNVVERDIRDFEIASGVYEFIVAIHVFPFLSRAEFGKVAAAVTKGLTPGGLLCCTLFGIEDEWARTRPRMTFFTQSEIEASFASLQPLVLRDRRFSGSDAKGAPKQWHVYQCIYRRAAA